VGSVFAAVLTMISNLGQDFQSEILPVTIYVLLGFGLFKLLISIFANLLFSNECKSIRLKFFW
jgi:hypothetical protein